MSIDIGNYPENVENAVRVFWKERSQATQKQKKSGNLDQGDRSAVTGGKNLDGFANMLIDLVKKNGLKDIEIHTRSTTIPGYFRALKNWDLLVIRNEKLIAAIELKSLCSPSVGKNLNNRIEEALGLGIDFQVAAREHLFGKGRPPFTGYFILLEDEAESHKLRKVSSSHFPADEAFQSASYATRLQLLCERMMSEQLFDAASVIVSPRVTKGEFSDVSDSTSIKNFLAAFASRIAESCV